MLDQGDRSSCTGNALAQLINSDPFAVSRPNGYLTEDDAVKLYSLATQVDDFPGTYPPDDTGSSGLGVAKAGVQLGYFNAYDHVFGFDHFTAALQTQPLIVGTSWLQDMYQPNSQGFVSVSGSVAGGHEYLALGVDYESSTLTFLNSWGASFGLGGRFKMTFSSFSRLLADQGDATAPVVPVVPTPTPTPPQPETGCCAKLRKIRAILAEK